MFKKLSVKYVIILCVLVLSTGCTVLRYIRGEEIWFKSLYYGTITDHFHYEIEVCSDDAKDITLYVPFPCYKKRPYGQALEWMKEYVNDELKFYSGEYHQTLSQCNPIIIKTEYGTMLKIYIPKLSKKEYNGQWHPGGFYLTTNTNGEKREIATSRKSMKWDYTLNFEQYLEHVEEKRVKGGYLKRRFDVPVYVQFEGEKLQVKLSYEIMEDYGAPVPYLTYFQNVTFTKSGWQKAAIDKLILIGEMPWD